MLALWSCSFDFIFLKELFWLCPSYFVSRCHFIKHLYSNMKIDVSVSFPLFVKSATRFLLLFSYLWSQSQSDPTLRSPAALAPACRRTTIIKPWTLSILYYYSIQISPQNTIVVILWVFFLCLLIICFFYFICICGFRLACLYTTCVPGAHRSQEKNLNSLDLELQEVESPYGYKEPNQVCCKCSKHSPQTSHLFSSCPVGFLWLNTAF